MKVKIFQKKWHNIFFRELDADLSLFKLPNQNFYKKFYKVFFEKYKSYNDLDLTWKKYKLKTLKNINFFFSKNSKILSYGSGLSFIENKLHQTRKDLHIDCYDLIHPKSRWLNIKNNKIKFLSNLKKEKKYDYILLIQLLYCFDDNELLNLLKKLKLFLNKKGKILTINSLPENYSFIKEFLKPIYYFFFKKKDMQFWGYLRDESEIKNKFEILNYRLLKRFNHENQAYQIFGLKK